MTPLLALGAIGAGSLLALKAACDARLGALSADPLIAAGVGLAVAGLGLSALTLASGLPPSSRLAEVPLWLWLSGGLLTALATSTLCWLIPQQGLGRVIPLCLAGQLITSLCAAGSGWLGLPRAPLSPAALLGALCALVGVFALTFDPD